MVLKNNDGGILKPCEIELNIDKTAPEGVTIEYINKASSVSNGINVANSVIQGIKYHYFGGDEEKKVTVRLSAEDGENGSGIAGFYYINVAAGDIEEHYIVADNGKAEVTLDLKTNVNEEDNGYILARAKDIAGNAMENVVNDSENNKFVYDTVGANVNVEIYSDKDAGPFADDDGWYYFNKNAKIEVEIAEANFHSEDAVIEVTTITENATTTETYNNWELAKDTDTKKYKQVIDLNGGDYSITVRCKDKSGNTSDFTEGKVKAKAEAPNPNSKTYKVVVDTFAPKVSISPNTKFYNKDAKLTLTVNEKHFDPSNTIVKDNGTTVTGVEWSTNDKKVYTAEYIVKGNRKEEGLHSIVLESTDKGHNASEPACQDIIMDITAPKISIEFADKSKKEYFTSERTATITVEEDYFNEAPITITAKKLNGDAVENSYEMSSWSKNGNKHTKKITFKSDANYEIEVNSTDKAGNSGDKATAKFTIDRGEPKDGLKITYSFDDGGSPVYTKNNVVVTLHAKDDVSGIKQFKYSTIKAGGSSGINSGYVTDQQVKASYDEDNKVFIGTFTINPQFDGYIEFSAIDNAGNESALTKDDKRIVVDNKAPTSSVTFNTPVQNVGGTSYYDGNITATININEANFNAGNITVSATKDGVNYPVSTSWSGSGDSHTGIVTLSEDGDYNVSISGEDMAGNNMTTYTSENLTIDTDITEPVITVNGLEADGKAFKDKVVPAVKFEDTNLESYEITLLRTRYGEKNVDVTEEFIKNHMSVDMNTGVGEGEFDEFAKVQDNDGIYTLNAKITDKAGHESEKEIVFTVNRYGSIYVYDDYLVDLIADGGAYVQSIDKDLIITEYNPDKLVSQSLNVEISKDGKPLEIAAPAISPEINDRVTTGSSGWYQYQYTISKDNFAADGIYKIVVSSKDETGNNPQNTNYEDKTILFRVDSTAPEINSITGLENKIINATGVTVKYTIFDTISLASVDVYVNGEKVESVSDFGDDFNNYSGEVQLKESSSEQSVRIVATDKAGNVTDTDSSDFTSAYKFNSKVTVSTNVFVRWFANKLLFFGSIAGVLILIGGVSFLIVLGKRRKKKTA